MYVEKSSVGLGGRNAELACVGGKNAAGALRTTEIYSLERDKWDVAANLHMERSWPGICFFENRAICCYCGISKQRLKSIERIELNSSSPKWTKIAVPAIMDATYHLKAIEYDEKVLIFGGFFDEKSQMNSFMVLLSSDGKSDTKFDYAPLMQGHFPCVVRNGALYCVSRKKMQENIRKFDGARWITEFE